ncbi:glycosyltransferase family 2 protein [Paracoccus sp. 1_MG-2023]|uniref:glycosyltransferase family 2 protein n=1 Tax=unclassified Paracoccus (in: a-proteobacteria) TaxID=2688777 RepID=UPI001C097003|nr:MULTISPECIES: glycosyltransferase family 2 protein [unclassified Paracoccus (in: a-proteobacteria)]MBU2958003.1 glycosyltransferase family 2 protein [Paracoccus sp. C2R09]MDO6668803.1 glycosyltransferase family 2 protein [Paracoccus sp. 1_MG-2023]
MTRPTIITLSSIPPRFDRIGPTLEAIVAQTLPAAEVRLYIPNFYRRFPNWDGKLPEVPQGVTIHRCEDLGPATKILPACRDLAGQDVDILFGDDDKRYDQDWHGRFKACRERHPGFCIVEAGETLPDIADDRRDPSRLPRAARWGRKPISYRLRRLLSGFRVKSSIYAQSGFVDILNGHGGVMVRPDWFGPEAFRIPDIIWTVDDPWLSGHLEHAGIPIWLNAGVSRIESFEIGTTHSLLAFCEQGHGRVEADLAAIDHLRRSLGIWQPCGQPAAPAGHMGRTMKALALRACHAAG